ncbi:MAG: asparagine synthetase B [Candidatus Xenobia bacterium]
MCGIVGVVDGRSPVDPALLARMRDSLAHRGPDGAGLWLCPEGRAGLAHRRLAVLDLTPEAAQPMTNEDGTLWLTYNGEIYNHAELRAELSRHRFRTRSSDTEVILHGYEEWGVGVLQRLRGMFAFGLYDSRSGKLLLARDRLGVKPLYYTRAGTSFLFASEIKALLLHPQVARRMDERALGHYLTFLTTPAPGTLFEGIFKLPAGHSLELEPGGSERLERYWELWQEVRDLSGLGEEEVAERLLQELRTSVRLRQLADVPVGVLLSGGLDSSTNAALFAETGPVKTFSVDYHGDPRSQPSELAHARLMARRVGAEHHEVRLTLQDLHDFLPRMIELQDEPLGDPVSVPLYYVSRLAREHGVVVVHVGEGADELFWGYPTWRLKLRLEQLNRLPVPMACKSWLLRLLRWAGASESRAFEALRRATRGQPIFWGGADIFTEERKNRLLRTVVRPSWEEALAPHWERFQRLACERSPLNWMSYLDLCLRLPELLLMRVDKMTMGASLEARVPFLDHRLVELSMGIGQRLKTRGGRLKHILKRAVAPLLPAEIVERPKQGFGVPLTEWLREGLRAPMEASVLAFCRRSEAFDPVYARRLLGGDPQRAWTLYNLALWHERWIAS